MTDEMEKAISIITINYNGVKDTCELMDTLPLENESLEVIVVDNASTPDEASIIKQRYPQVIVTRKARTTSSGSRRSLKRTISLSVYGLQMTGC